MSIFGFLKKDKGELRKGNFHVEEGHTQKILKYDDITYSKLRKGSVYTGEYWDFFIPTAYIHPNPKVLLIGLGGGTVVLQLTSLLADKVDLDVIEIDQGAVELSKEFIPNLRANVIVGDGAEYVHTTKKKYDAVLLDAYTSTKIPDQFFTNRFIFDVYEVLSTEGVLAINYAMNFMGSVRFYDYTERLKRKFHTYQANTGFFEGNVMIISSKKFQKEEIMERIGVNMHLDDKNRQLFKNYAEMKAL